MAEWSAQCSSDSECENLFVAIGEQFKTRDLKQVLSSVRDGETKLECLRNVKRRKFSKKVNVVGEVSKQEYDMQASDTTPTDMQSPLSSGGRELQYTHQQQRHNLSAFDYNDDFPALIGVQRRSPVIKKKKKVVAQLDHVMSNYTRHKQLDEQQMRFGKQEVLQQRLHLPIHRPVALINTKQQQQSTVPQADLSFDSDSDDETLNSHGFIQSQIQKVGKLLENDGLT